MAGTDHGKADEAAAAGPAFVLVSAQMGENIGAAARGMWNFGLSRLRLVNPRDGWPNERAVAMASGAAPVLDRAGVFETTDAACADLDYVFATTARPRGLIKKIFTPERAMEVARKMIAEGGQVGILFGPERAGLANSDVVRVNAVIAVPVNPAFGSLNLAQCVLLCAYEWRRQGVEVDPEVMELAGARPATGIEVDRLRDHLVERLDAAAFFFPEPKRESMLANLENLLRRAAMTDADVRTLHGVIRALAEKAPGRK